MLASLDPESPSKYELAYPENLFSDHLSHQEGRTVELVVTDDCVAT